MHVIHPHTSECMNCELYITTSALPHTVPLYLSQREYILSACAVLVIIAMIAAAEMYLCFSCLLLNIHTLIRFICAQRWPAETSPVRPRPCGAPVRGERERIKRVGRFERAIQNNNLALCCAGGSKTE